MKRYAIFCNFYSMIQCNLPTLSSSLLSIRYSSNLLDKVIIDHRNVIVDIIVALIIFRSVWNFSFESRCSRNDDVCTVIFQMGSNRICSFHLAFCRSLVLLGWKRALYLEMWLQLSDRFFFCCQNWCCRGQVDCEMP